MILVYKIKFLLAESVNVIVGLLRLKMSAKSNVGLINI